MMWSTDHLLLEPQHHGGRTRESGDTNVVALNQSEELVSWLRPFSGVLYVGPFWAGARSALATTCTSCTSGALGTCRQVVEGRCRPRDEPVAQAVCCQVGGSGTEQRTALRRVRGDRLDRSAGAAP